MAASCEGTPKMVHLLLANGANPNLVDNFKHSAIDYSTQNQSESYGFMNFFYVKQYLCIAGCCYEVWYHFRKSDFSRCIRPHIYA